MLNYYTSNNYICVCQQLTVPSLLILTCQPNCAAMSVGLSSPSSRRPTPCKSMWAASFASCRRLARGDDDGENELRGLRLAVASLCIVEAIMSEDVLEGEPTVPLCVGDGLPGSDSGSKVLPPSHEVLAPKNGMPSSSSCCGDCSGSGREPASHQLSSRGRSVGREPSSHQLPPCATAVRYSSSSSSPLPSDWKGEGGGGEL